MSRKKVIALQQKAMERAGFEGDIPFIKRITFFHTCKRRFILPSYHPAPKGVALTFFTKSPKNCPDSWDLWSGGFGP